MPYVCLIFANTREEAAATANALREADVPVIEIHGGLQQMCIRDRLAAYGILGMLTYVITTAFFRLPQHLFHMSLPAMVRRMTRRFVR